MQTGVRPLRSRKSKINLYALLIVPYFYFLVAFIYRAFVPAEDLSGNVYGNRKLLWVEEGEEGANVSATEAVSHDFPHINFPFGMVGAIVFPTLITGYIFLFLATVCDAYFVPCIDIVCQKLELSNDVAGATLMASGTSSPELFINLIGTFLTEGDVGTGTVVGSGVFNMLAVPALCILLCRNQKIRLDYWPLTRDSLIYMVSVLILAFSLQDGKVMWYEALAMVFFYYFYIIVMKYNSSIRRISEGLTRQLRRKRWSIWEDGVLWPLIPTTSELRLSKPHLTMAYSCEEVFLLIEDSDFKGWSSRKTLLSKIQWLCMVPLMRILRWTIPPCHYESYQKFVALTFVMCIFWIAVCSYFIAWMITILGNTLEVPDSVMGLTFIAAGMSIPETVSSVIVAGQGQGSMALSNSWGSSTFDILLCLGIPWLVKSTYFPNQPGPDGHFVQISSHGLEYSSFALLLILFLVYSILYFNKFKLDKKIGVVFLIMYWIFIGLFVLNELNFFFDFTQT